MAEVTDEALVAQLRVLLAVADKDTITVKALRKALEDHFKTDLSDRKQFVADSVDLLLSEREEKDAKESQKQNDSRDSKKHDVSVVLKPADSADELSVGAFTIVVRAPHCHSCRNQRQASSRRRKRQLKKIQRGRKWTLRRVDSHTGRRLG
jgi:hypothetical protein